MRESGASTITPRPGVDLFRAGPDTYGPSHPVPTPPHNGRRGHGVASPYGHAGAGYAVPYGYGPYAFAPYAPAESSRQVPTDAAGAREVTHGFLRLLINPRSAAVFVDGRYEGTADDFGGSGEHSLPAGPHRVRVEGEGYEPVAFEVRVPENDTITLRRELELRADPPAAAPAPAGPPVARKTLYVIPRCYLGDTPPLPEQLPAGCRIADLRTIPPG